jgi:uncharacterized membrane protein
VLALMALDHTRDFVMGMESRPTDLATTTVPLFMTRWVTHFCAPLFVLLAGVGAYFVGKRDGRAALTRFLVTRGFLLILIEFTVVRASWLLNLNYRFVVMQVIWVIGVSMIILAALAQLPVRAVAAVGALTVLMHNLLDGVQIEGAGLGHAIWRVLHEPGRIEAVTVTHLRVIYPVIPWFGVMALGYGLGLLLDDEPMRRQRRLFALGFGFTFAFIVLRWAGVYGDPHPFVAQATTTKTLLAFLNCEKYPPSLEYLLMTLGPGLLALAILDRLGDTSPRAPLMAFGRVSLFFYVVHILTIHLVVIVLVFAVASDEARRSLLDRGAPNWPLSPVYLVWLTSLLLLYPACRWYQRIKPRYPVLRYF